MAVAVAERNADWLSPASLGCACAHWLLQAILTDMAANGGRLQEINRLADSMVNANHAEKPHIRKRQKEINDK